MGLCSIYCGFIYNEFFAIPLDLFGTRWEFRDGSKEASWNGASIAYPFGVDPTWKGAQNELTYYNSLKMKISIIFGVAQVRALLSRIIITFLKIPTYVPSSLSIKRCRLVSCLAW